MAKFAKGDKVESVKTGAKGVVDEVYGDEKYAVLFDGAKNPDRVEGFQIKAANAKACNAVSTGLKDADGKYLNVGDVVVHTSSRLHGRVIGKYNSYLINVKWENGFVEECNPDDVKKWSPPGLSNSTNPAARNAKFKEGDRVKIVSGGSLSGKTGRVARISSDSIGVYADVIMDDNGREEQVPIDILHIANSRAPRSTNAVVQNAINVRRARNADIGKALMDAISACRKLAETARKEGNEEERQRAIKAGTALYGMKPSW